MIDRLARRRKIFQKGVRAETLTSVWLRLKGYRILAQRLRTSSGEIDLIARKGTLVLIVEVKARDTLQAAMEAVTAAQQRRIEAAADLWLTRQPDYARLRLRFDLVAIMPRRLPVHIPAFFTV